MGRLLLPPPLGQPEDVRRVLRSEPLLVIGRRSWNAGIYSVILEVGVGTVSSRIMPLSVPSETVKLN